MKDSEVFDRQEYIDRARDRASAPLSEAVAIGKLEVKISSLRREMELRFGNVEKSIERVGDDIRDLAPAKARTKPPNGNGKKAAPMNLWGWLASPGVLQIILWAVAAVLLGMGANQVVEMFSAALAAP